MWNNPENWLASPLHLAVVAHEKGTFGSPSTLVTNLSNNFTSVYSEMETAIHRISTRSVEANFATITLTTHKSA